MDAEDNFVGHCWVSLMWSMEQPFIDPYEPHMEMFPGNTLPIFSSSNV